MIDNDLKLLAESWASSCVDMISKAFSDPLISLDEEQKQIYSEFKEFGLFEEYPIECNDAKRFLYFHLAIRKYGKLKWAKEHPPKEKKSKWNMVVNRTPKVRR